LACRPINPYSVSERISILGALIVSKTISWSYRLHEIRERVERSKIQTWSRRDLEDLFEIKRASAQSLMKAIGGIQNIGGTHLVDRDSLLEFLSRSIESDDLSGVVQRRRLEAGPVPKTRPLAISLPTELRSVMAADLPAQIQLEAGRLTITGADSEEILEALCLLAQAMQNDLDSIQSLLDPLPVPPPVEDDDLRHLFRDLAKREIQFKSNSLVSVEDSNLSIGA
jgi:hypothetical protein